MDRQIKRLLLETAFVEGIIPFGNGLMAFQDVPQARSVMNRSAIEQQNSANVPAVRVDHKKPEIMAVTQRLSLSAVDRPTASADD